MAGSIFSLVNKSFDLDKMSPQEKATFLASSEARRSSLSLPMKAHSVGKNTPFSILETTPDTSTILLSDGKTRRVIPTSQLQGAIDQSGRTILPPAVGNITETDIMTAGIPGLGSYGADSFITRVTDAPSFIAGGKGRTFGRDNKVATEPSWMSRFAEALKGAANKVREKMK